jgi:hypothetical protein
LPLLVITVAWCLGAALDIGLRYVLIHSYEITVRDRPLLVFIFVVGDIIGGLVAGFGLGLAVWRGNRYPLGRATGQLMVAWAATVIAKASVIGLVADEVFHWVRVILVYIVSDMWLGTAVPLLAERLVQNAAVGLLGGWLTARVLRRASREIDRRLVKGWVIAGVIGALTYWLLDNLVVLLEPGFHFLGQSVPPLIVAVGIQGLVGGWQTLKVLAHDADRSESVLS